MSDRPRRYTPSISDPSESWPDPAQASYQDYSTPDDPAEEDLWEYYETRNMDARDRHSQEALEATEDMARQIEAVGGQSVLPRPGRAALQWAIKNRYDLDTHLGSKTPLRRVFKKKVLNQESQRLGEETTVGYRALHMSSKEARKRYRDPPPQFPPEEEQPSRPPSIDSPYYPVNPPDYRPPPPAGYSPTFAWPAYYNAAPMDATYTDQFDAPGYIPHAPPPPVVGPSGSQPYYGPGPSPMPSGRPYGVTNSASGGMPNQSDSGTQGARSRGRARRRGRRDNGEGTAYMYQDPSSSRG